MANAAEFPAKRQKANALVLFAAAAVLIGVAGFLAWESIRFLRDAVETEATVTGHPRDRQSKEKFARHFEAEFIASEGETVRFISRSSSKSMERRYPVGSTVPLRYFSGEPGKAKHASFFSFWGWPLLTAAFGILLVAAGIHVRRNASGG